MKKLIIGAAMIAAVFCVQAEEAAPAAAAPVAPEKPAAAAPAAKPVRPKLDRAQIEERMKARRAEHKQKIVEVLKKYGLVDEQAQACAEDILNIGRRQPRMPRQPKAAKPAAEAK